MRGLSTSQKGAAAEAEIAAAAIRLDLVVLRPLGDGGRYDLAIDTGKQLLRVQCKWASRQGEVIMAYCITCRHTPGGYRRKTYSSDEIDAIAIYSPDTDKCYLIPVREVDGYTTISLRLGPTRNNQAIKVRWAKDYELERSIAPRWAASPELHDFPMEAR
jgi:PD-(D/E)XK endonuclease